MITRRTFSTNLAATAAVAASTPFTAKSYAAIAGANERVNFAICGLNGRGGAHLSALGGCFGQIDGPLVVVEAEELRLRKLLGHDDGRRA